MSEVKQVIFVPAYHKVLLWDDETQEWEGRLTGPGGDVYDRDYSEDRDALEEWLDEKAGELQADYAIEVPPEQWINREAFSRDLREEARTVKDVKPLTSGDDIFGGDDDE